MGWGRGSSLFSEVIDVIQGEVKDFTVRKIIYIRLIEAFESADCDTLDECYGDDPAFDKVWDEMYPSDEEDE